MIFISDAYRVGILLMLTSSKQKDYFGMKKKVSSPPAKYEAELNVAKVKLLPYLSFKARVCRVSWDSFHLCLQKPKKKKRRPRKGVIPKVCFEK